MTGQKTQATGKKRYVSIVSFHLISFHLLCEQSMLQFLIDFSFCILPFSEAVGWESGRTPGLQNIML